MAGTFDAIVVGAGPNGLAAAITLQLAGVKVLLLEAKDTIGGGMRTAGVTLPGFRHDICSTVHPLAAQSPFFKALPLQQYGVEFLYPPLAAAHPFNDGSAAILTRSIEETARHLQADEQAYWELMAPLANRWPALLPGLLGPLRVPAHPISLAGFGFKGIQSATRLANRFTTPQAKGLLAGMAAHGMQPLQNIATSAIALVLMLAGHTGGWPVIKGGTQALADALAQYFTAIGGTVQTNHPVNSFDALPAAKAVLLDVTPRQLMSIAGNQFSKLYSWQMKRFRYGMGVFKIDWALSEPAPFTNPLCRQAGTVHIGNTLHEIARYEKEAAQGKVGAAPFVLFAQQSQFDASRAPAGKHTAWAYCHVPHGYNGDMTRAIEQQVERFAPGFGDTIMGRHTMSAAGMEAYNPNYIGGDINGGVIDITQLFTRPVLRISPYTTSADSIFICSSSTPPGGGVHGMCGYYAAKKALQQVFDIHNAVELVPPVPEEYLFTG